MNCARANAALEMLLLKKGSFSDDPPETAALALENIAKLKKHKKKT